MNCHNCDTYMDSEDASYRTFRCGKMQTYPLTLFCCPECGTEGQKTRGGKLHITHDVINGLKIV